MAESDSSTGSSLQDSDSDDSQSMSLSSVVSEELLLAEPSEVLPYRFEPEYDSRLEDRGESSGLLAVVTEDREIDHIANIEW